jgi:Cdc6-like AAA superfamily ATPase
MQPSSEREAESSNRHITEFLKYYFSFRGSPHYAVLLKGAWGIGKTHLIKQVLTTLAQQEIPYCYVSLFGVGKIEDIDDALLSALYPAMFSSVGKLAGHAAKAALKFFKIDSDMKPKEFLDKFAADIYIFDDLERSEMSVNRIMGYINAFVEHDGCKVVILANEDQISSDELPDYLKRKEKIVGKTLEVQPAFNEALKKFLEEIRDSEARSFYGD